MDGEPLKDLGALIVTSAGVRLEYCSFSLT